MMSFGQRARIAIALASVVGVLTGCSTSSTPSASSEPAAAALSFLMAVHDGNYATALSLSTSSASDFACKEMVTDGHPNSRHPTPTVTSVEVDGSRATAKSLYRAIKPYTLRLSRIDGSWRVEIPENFRISLTFDAPTVAKVAISDTCSVPVVDKAVNIAAWPGTYPLYTSDPSGVFGDHELLTIYNVDDQSAPEVVPAVPDESLPRVSSAAIVPLDHAMSTCFNSGFSDPACPPGLAGIDPPTLDIQDAILTESRTLDRVWTDDGATWRFETKPATVAVSFGGKQTAVTFTRKGTLSVDAAGKLATAIDAP